MAIEFTSAELIYSGQQVSASNKVLVGAGYIIRIGVSFIDEGDEDLFWVTAAYDEYIPGIYNQSKTFSEISSAVSAASPQLPVYKLSGYNNETLILPLERLTSSEAKFGGSYLAYSNSKLALRHITVTVTASDSSILDTTINDAEGGAFG